MSNERYNQIIDEAYENYTAYMNNDLSETRWHKTWISDDGKSMNGRQYTKEEFIDKCKTDSEFSEKWRLKIEERELSQWERVKLLQEFWKNNGIGAGHEEVSTLWAEYNNLMTKYTIPAKIITVTYNNEKIEIYE